MWKSKRFIKIWQIRQLRQEISEVNALVHDFHNIAGKWRKNNIFTSGYLPGSQSVYPPSTFGPVGLFLLKFIHLYTLFLFRFEAPIQ